MHAGSITALMPTDYCYHYITHYRIFLYYVRHGDVAVTWMCDMENHAVAHGSSFCITTR